jgi:hypothetical protein
MCPPLRGVISSAVLLFQSFNVGKPQRAAISEGHKVGGFKCRGEFNVGRHFSPRFLLVAGAGIEPAFPAAWNRRVCRYSTRHENGKAKRAMQVSHTSRVARSLLQFSAQALSSFP